MSNLSGINLSGVQAAEEYTPIPAGSYESFIEKAEVKPTKDRLGMYVEMLFQITGPESKGRKVFYKFNIKNNNPQAVEIGLSELKMCAVACGIPDATDTSEFEGKFCEIKIKVKEANGNFDASNDIKSFKPIGGNPTGSNSATPNGHPPANHQHAQNTPPSMAPSQAPPINNAPPQHAQHAPQQHAPQQEPAGYNPPQSEHGAPPGFGQ